MRYNGVVKVTISSLLGGLSGHLSERRVPNQCDETRHIAEE